MDRLVIRGGNQLKGSGQIHGAQNAALPQIAAALLSTEPLEIGNIPDLLDIATMLGLMQELGVTAERRAEGNLLLDPRAARNSQASYDIVRRMRASILVLGPLVARFGSARVSLPGGCAIGARPVDLHLKALTALGAAVPAAPGAPTAQAPAAPLRGDRH